MKKSQLAAKVLEAVFDTAKENGNFKLSNQDLSDVGETLSTLSTIFGQTYIVCMITGKKGMDVSDLKEILKSEKGSEALRLLDLSPEEREAVAHQEMEKRMREHVSVTNKTFSD